MREIVWDTETTGVNHNEDRIVEIGAVELVDLLPTGRTFHTYINPQRDVPQHVVKVHGLTYDFLKKYPVFRRKAQAFLDFIGDARLVAHNAPFDLRFINAELARINLPPLQNEIVDTLELARKVKKGGSHKLDVLCNHFGVDTSKRVLHGALLDSEILAEVYLHLRGGRQHAIPLVVEAVAEVEVVHAHGSRTIVPRGTPGEREAHIAFVSGIKDAIWSRYTP